MEYRVFTSITESVFATKWKTDSRADHRTDIYYLLGGENNSNDSLPLNNGLKLRNQKYVELKTCSARFPNGQEQWTKTVQSFEKIRAKDMQSVKKVLTDAHQYALVERLQACEPVILCYVQKYTRGKQSVGGARVELTGLSLTFVSHADERRLGQKLFFETVCVEQLDPNFDSLGIVRIHLPDLAESTMHTMGYPQLIARQWADVMRDLPAVN